MVKVAVIIPTYGKGEYISRAIDSVLAQDYSDIEIIVVDDNGKGTENQLLTQKRVEKYLTNNQIKYIVHEKNKNGSAARNTGARSTDAEFIAFLDDDDEYLPYNIGLHLKAWKTLDDSYAFSYISNIARFKTHDEFRIKRQSGYLLFEILCHRVVAGSSSIMIKRQIFEELNGFDETFKRHQDWEFTARAAAKYRIKAIEEIGFIYNIIGRNRPKTLESLIECREHFLNKMQPIISSLPLEQQRIVFLSNWGDIIINYIKRKKFKGAYRECKEKGIKFSEFLWIIMKRIKSHIKRFKQRFFNNKMK